MKNITYAAMADRRARIGTQSVEAAPPQPSLATIQAGIDTLIGDVQTAEAAGLPAPSAPPSSGVVNSPVTWPQFLGAVLSDLLDPAIMLPVLGVIVNWLQSDEPATVRGLVTVGVLALISLYKAIQTATGSTALQLRLRAMGQIRGGL